jgi:O-antigen/teichoic acid export membrane protein
VNIRSLLGDGLNNGFIRKLFTLVSGTVLAQVIPLALSPLLTRLFSNEAFGVFTTFFTVVSIISIIVALRLELAIVLPKDDAEAIDLLSSAVYVSIAFALLTLIACIVCFLFAVHPFVNSHPFVFFAIPVSVFFNGVIQSFTYWNNRKATYKIISYSRVLNAGIANVFPLLLAVVFIPLTDGIVYGYVIGQCCAIAIFIVLSVDGLLWKQLMAFSWKKMKTVVYAYKQFPLLNAPSSFIDQLAASMSVLFISFYFSMDTAGIFGLTNRVMAVPAALISMAFSQVVYQHVAAKINQGEQVFAGLIKSSKLLFLLALIPFSILFIGGGDLFAFVFGENWRLAGEFARLLAFTGIIRFVASTLSITLAATGGLKLLAVWQVGYFLCNVVMLAIVYYLQLTAYQYLVMIAVADIVLYGVYLYLIFYAAKRISLAANAIK